MKHTKIVCLVLLLFVIPTFVISQTTESKPKKDQVFTIVENMPEFPGGMKELYTWLRNHLKYPKEAKANGIHGKVYVNFVVGKDGLIRNSKVIRGVHPLLDNEALRVVGIMPLWTPGTQRGKEVSVAFNLPIHFRLEDPESNANETDKKGTKKKRKNKKKPK